MKGPVVVLLKKEIVVVHFLHLFLARCDSGKKRCRSELSVLYDDCLLRLPEVGSEEDI